MKPGSDPGRLAFLGAAWVVLRKELVDGLRDRRSLVSALLFPLLGPLLLAASLTAIIRMETKEDTVELPVIGRERAPGLVAYLEGHGVRVVDGPADPEESVRSGATECVLVVPEDYEEAFRTSTPAPVELFADSSRRDGQSGVRHVRIVLESYSREIGALRLLARGVNPSVAEPLAVRDVDLATPQKRAAQILTMIPLFLLLAVFVGGMHVAIDATAGERERGSLEPLLLTPVARTAIVTGKALAAMCFAAASAALTLALFVVAMSRVPLSEVRLELHLGLAECAGALAAVLPAVPLAASIELLMGSFARSFKEAQTYISVLLILPMAPGLMLTLAPFKEQTWMMAVPGLGPTLLLDRTLRGEGIDFVGVGLSALTSVVLAALLLYATGKLFEREKVIFGGP